MRELDTNDLRNIFYCSQKLEKPIKAPLQQLNLGSCRLEMVPDLGILPKLLVMNMSNNPMSEVTVQQFSPFCRLISIEIQNGTQMPPCMCKALKLYFRNRSITLKEGLDCSTENEGRLLHSYSTCYLRKSSFDYIFFLGPRFSQMKFIVPKLRIPRPKVHCTAIVWRKWKCKNYSKNQSERGGR